MSSLSNQLRGITLGLFLLFSPFFFDEVQALRKKLPGLLRSEDFHGGMVVSLLCSGGATGPILTRPLFGPLISLLSSLLYTTEVLFIQ